MGEKATPERVQVGWIPDYVLDDIVAGERVDGWDLDILGLDEATGSDRFTLNGGPFKHRYLPVFVEVPA